MSRQRGQLTSAPVTACAASSTSKTVRAERQEGVWRLSGLDAVYLRDEIVPVIPGQSVAVDPEEVKAFRPTYRLLSYCLASGGFPARNDLAGVDRPDLVDALAPHRLHVEEWLPKATMPGKGGFDIV